MERPEFAGGQPDHDVQNPKKDKPDLPEVERVKPRPQHFGPPQGPPPPPPSPPPAPPPPPGVPE